MAKVVDGRLGAPPGEKSRLGYQPALDGVRAFAALTVVGFHLRLPGFDGGGLGVDIFFVLSGFLITGILLSELSRTGTVSFGRFYVRRALRLLPAYFAVVLFAMALWAFVVPVGGTPRGVLASFFYVGNWVAGQGMGLGMLGHTWSLSVEEQFYLVWPLLIFLGYRLLRGGNRVIGFVAGILALAWAITLLFVGLGAPFDILNNGTHFRATELLAGALLAVLASRGHLRALIARPRIASALGVAALAGLVGLVVFGVAESNGALLVTWLGVSVCTTLLLATLQAPGTLVGRALSWRPLVAIGIVSYGIYLWHFPVMVAIDTVYGLESIGARLAALGITAVLVVGSYFLIERPFLRLKDRVGSRRKRDAAGSPDTADAGAEAEPLVTPEPTASTSIAPVAPVTPVAPVAPVAPVTPVA